MGVAPAVVQLEGEGTSERRPKPITWLPESPMKTAARSRRPQVEGEEADAGPAERERDGQARLARVPHDRIDREDGARHRGERRGQAVHVVEEVERVRDPDEPDEAQHRREHVVADHLDREAGAEHRRRGPELGDELRHRAERVDVVNEPGREENRAKPARIRRAPTSPPSRRPPARLRSRRAGRRRWRPEHRCGALVPAAPEGAATSRPGAFARSNATRMSAATETEATAAIAFTGGKVEHVCKSGVCGHRPTLIPLMTTYLDLFRYTSSTDLFRRDLRAKYKGSVLGLAWSLAHPVVLMLVYLLVFSVLLSIQTADYEHYWLFLLAGLPIWVFFATSLQSSARSLLENANLIRKVRFRQLVPLSMVATQLVGFAVMLAIVVVLSLVYLPEARDTVWLALPLAVLAVGLVAGLSLAVASLNAVYRDVEHLVAALLLPWFFLTPVLYSLESIPGVRDHPRLVGLIHWGNPPPHAAIEAGPRSALLRRAARRRRRDLPRRLCRARARPRRVRLQPGRRPRGGRSLIRPSKSDGSPSGS